jgi:hypothetical protein
VKAHLAPLLANGGAVVSQYASTYHLSAVAANTGSHQMPLIGDVISFAASSDFSAPDGSPGHVGVVSGVALDPTTGNGTITVVGENQYPPVAGGGYDDDAFPMTVSGWQIKSFVGGNPYIQWLVLPPPAPTTVPPAAPKWTWTRLPLPHHSQDVQLEGISCPTTTFCVAVGALGGVTDNAGYSQPLSAMWKDGTWTLRNVPNPAGADGTSLQGVSCTSPSWCMAVGQAERLRGSSPAHAVVWNGASWVPSTVQGSALGANDFDDLDGVSCTTPDWCIAVGFSESSSHEASLAATWNGHAWSLSVGLGKGAVSAVSVERLTR